jgi:hypothetical protein
MKNLRRIIENKWAMALCAAIALVVAVRANLDGDLFRMRAALFVGCVACGVTMGFIIFEGRQK